MDSRAVFCDIESLSLRGNALVLSVGAVIVDLDEPEPFDAILARSTEVILDRDPQVIAKRHIDLGTVQWWESQSDKAQRVVDPPAAVMEDPADWVIRLAQGLRVSQDVLKQLPWYFRGPHFDAAVLGSLCDDFLIPRPWHYNMVRDVRTAMDGYGISPSVKIPRPNSMIPHNAAHDAVFDAYQLMLLHHQREHFIALLEGPQCQ